MSKLSRLDLWSLEDYAEQRIAFRDRVMTHKKDRQLALDGNLRLYFEDRLTIQYQIQEMLRIERIFEISGIEEELEAYNPLIPDGGNWKATFMIEYADPYERAKQLARLLGIEGRIWLQVGDCDRVFAIADEDLERDTSEKTSAVHFLRFELSPITVAAACAGENITAGVDHPTHPVAPFVVPESIRASLVRDLIPTSIN